jgi:hypothetical protein
MNYGRTEIRGKNMQEMRWRSDLRNDEANGHLAAKRAFEGTGVDE